MAAWIAELKPCCVVLYGAFGVLCLWLARRSEPGGSLPPPAASNGWWFPVLLAGAGPLLAGFAATGSHLLLAAEAIGMALFALRHAARTTPRHLLAAAATLALVLSLAWWRIAPSPAAPWPLAAFAAVLAGLLAGLSDPPGSNPGSRRPGSFAIPVLVAVLAALALLLDLGGYRPGQPILEKLAHHWGAFIGPALQLRAGLVPFYDMPLQYGLGPTLAIAAACRGPTEEGVACWRGMQGLVVGADLASLLLMLRMALATAVPRGPAWRCAVVVIVFAAGLLWPGNPAEGSSVLATPSVGGMRFLPTLLVAALLFFARPAAALAALVPAVLWSPESAAMSGTVWVLCETARVGLQRALVRAGLVLAGGHAGLVLLHRAAFGVWMDPLAFAEYVLHVPGPLPINPFSDALLLAAVLGLGGWLMARAPDPLTARRDRAATALLFATASYWLGRSHPNNVCNLAPFLVLVAVRALDRPAGEGAWRAETTGFGLAASVAALALSPWHAVPYHPGATLDIDAVVGGFGALEPDIERIRQQLATADGFADQHLSITSLGISLGIADFGAEDLRHPSETLVWTPLDPSSLWLFVPRERRRRYIERSSARLLRSGWAIFADERRFLLDDFRAGYTIAAQRDFFGAPGDGAPRHYLAVCFEPRAERAAARIGPACPRDPP